MEEGTNAHNPGFSHLIALIGGFAIATWAARESLAESKKSRAELDRPEEAEEAFKKTAEILDDWEPVDCETEE
jgi:nicotinate-nucleotide pyrophosphorylase